MLHLFALIALLAWSDVRCRKDWFANALVWVDGAFYLPGMHLAWRDVCDEAYLFILSM